MDPSPKIEGWVQGTDRWWEGDGEFFGWGGGRGGDTTYHHASESSICRHAQVPDGVTGPEFGVGKHDQQRCAAPKASAHSGAHCTSGHHLKQAIAFIKSIDFHHNQVQNDNRYNEIHATLVVYYGCLLC